VGVGAGRRDLRYILLLAAGHTRAYFNHIVQTRFYLINERAKQLHPESSLCIQDGAYEQLIPF
jgi:hypothetical protein